MLTHPTLDQLRALRLDGMADAFVELQSQDNARDLSHAEWLALLLDREAAKRDTSRFQTRLWGKADDLRLTVLMGLRRGLKLCRGMRRALTEDEQKKVAAVIVEDLERSNWKIEKGPMPEGHSRLMGK